MTFDVSKAAEEGTKKMMTEFNAAVDDLRKAAIPLVRVGKKDQGEQYGTATLVKLDEVHFICTAKHCLDDNGTSTLYAAAGDGQLVPIELEFCTAPAFDLAVALLEPELAARITHGRFIQKQKILSDITDAKYLGAACGFPASKSGVKYGTHIVRARRFTLTDTLQFNVDGFVRLKFTKEKISEDGQQVTAPDPYGMSGGPIFSREVTRHEAQTKLAGISIEWHWDKHVIKGVSSTTLIQFMQKCFGIK